MESDSAHERRGRKEKQDGEVTASSGSEARAGQSGGPQEDSASSERSASSAQRSSTAPQPRGNPLVGQFSPSPSSPSPFNLTGMAGALPEYGPSLAHGYQGSPALVPQSPQMQMYPSQQGMPYAGAMPGYPGPPYAGYGQPQYGSPLGQSPGSQFAGQMSYVYQNQRPSANVPYGGQYQQPPVPYYYPQSSYAGPSGSPTTFQSSNSSNYPANLRVGAPAIVSDSMGGDRSSGATGLPYSSPGPSFERGHRGSNPSSTTAIARGPPRKPKQSGHALWVGNLPPGATITDLKDHFSRDATRDIESLFLISKSNCAFVNYRTEEACNKAMQRFHDSRFQGVRLVCRPRKPSTAGSAAGSTAGSSTSLASVSSSSSKSPAPRAPLLDDVDENENEDEEVEATVPKEVADTRVPERYFIVKSLTLHDLEQSVRNGIWATQSHNEEALNKAYNNADNVYLIFSANKSGEYFGYARMASSIAENASEIFGTIHRTEVSELTDAPREILTPATEFAPKGRIIDDSVRGTIFWEAKLSDDEVVEEEPEIPDMADADPPTWGKPFKIEWISTNRVPFFRTRGLRNPWNANREVKIARDGTELEASVGRRLVHIFHRSGSLSAPSGSTASSQQ